MGVSERKEREKRKLRLLILDTAHKIFIKQGYENTSIRNIAKKIEYSPATLYLYFEDKEDILYRLKDRYFNEFCDKLNEFHFIKDHFSRLKNMSASYLDYALSNQKHYELMFFSNIKNPNKGNQKDPTGEQKAFSLFRDTVDACLKQNQIRRMPVEEATNVILSFLHGLSSLILKDKLTGIPRNRRKDHIQEVTNRFLISLKSV
ncbi:TetR/AcrR family transcriptional regulator [Bacteroidota bacterium]